MFRDTTITSASKRKELIIFLSSFIGAYILNVIGIIQHKSPARELFTQLHVVLLVALVIYGVVIVLRVLYYLVSRLWIRKQ
ncbi:MAG: hypothetical protein GY790_21830 [Bacteroidetes bacterium]|nr:hypothetical protein [Bacteroidota bacterium]